MRHCLMLIVAVSFGLSALLFPVAVYTQTPAGFCDGFESTWQSAWTSVPGVGGTPQPVTSPVHGGNTSLKFRSSASGNCGTAIYRTGFEAATGEYSAYVYQTHFQAGFAFYIQAQLTGPFVYGRDNYEIGFQAANAQGGGGMSLHRRKNDVQQFLSSKAVSFSMNEWVRVYVKRPDASTITVGYERPDGTGDSFTYTDPAPLTAPGKFIITSCADVYQTAHFWDDVCYNSDADGTSKVVIQSIRAYSAGPAGLLYTGTDNYIDVVLQNVGGAWGGKQIDILYELADRCWIGTENSWGCDAAHPMGSEVMWGVSELSNLTVPDIPAGASYTIVGLKVWFPRQWIDQIRLLPRSSDGSAWDESGYPPNWRHFDVTVYVNPAACDNCLSEWASVGSALPFKYVKTFGDFLVCTKGWTIGVAELTGGLALTTLGLSRNDANEIGRGLYSLFKAILTGTGDFATCFGKSAWQILGDVLNLIVSLAEIAYQEFTPTGGGGCGACWSNSIVDGKHAVDLAFNKVLDDVATACGENVICNTIVHLRCPVDATLTLDNGDSVAVHADGTIIPGPDSLIGLPFSDGKLFVFPGSSPAKIVARGVDSGTMSLTLRRQTVLGVPVKFNFDTVRVSPGAIFEVANIWASNLYPLIKIDSTGDLSWDLILLPTSASDSGKIQIAVTTSGASPAVGVAAGVYDAADNLVAVLVTGADGSCETDKLMLGEYQVVITTPLGYVADSEIKTVIVDDDSAFVSFELSSEPVLRNGRTRAYWAHQLSKAMQGKPPASDGHSGSEAGIWPGPSEIITKAEFSRFASLIGQHFNGNRLNPIEEYSVPQPAGQNDSLNVLFDLLTFRPRSQGEHVLRRMARAELIAMMLNVVSGKIAQFEPITMDGRTLSQAITYCERLTNDPDAPVSDLPPGYLPDYDHCCELRPWIQACRIGRFVNDGLMLPEGSIPSEILDIAYKEIQTDGILPASFALGQNYPNPFNSGTVISYALSEATHVRLEVFDVLGRRVSTLVDQIQPIGQHQVVWDGHLESGEPAASGMYFYRLRAGAFTESKKMILVK